ncbi:hypothetical protein JKA74_02845 [Marivirga sp. S37H4]|uniref:Outer membrane protein beta-barrel domain-containing protein n=1 Tax=Marivirga aurantiaca TaxID=2802615 RepID=A0A934WW04_9BACT|nr:outer membrane beta-barrel protein [Marivirga aurantiaca]MBK6263962.1 hypothetical protein [Marivirga aurantiaca]
MKRLIIIVLVIMGILKWHIVSAQENFISGYIIKNSNDTIFGLLDYRNWKKNPNRVTFKNNLKGNPVTYEPTEILEFAMGNEIYVRGIVNTEISSVQTNSLQHSPQLEIIVDTTFLQVLIRGEKSLYYYQKPEGRENFYIKQGTGFELLVYKRYLKQKDDKNVIIDNKKYLGQLSLYLKDCATIKLEKTQYKLNSLMELFQDYYNCTQSDISFQKEREKIDIEFGALLGASLTSLKFGSSAFDYLVDAEYNSSIDFTTGLFLDVLLLRNQRKWSIYNELLFTTYKVKGKYEVFRNESYYTITSTEIGYSYLKVNSLLRFKYPIGNLFLFINGGISNGLAINEKNYKKIDSKLYASERVVEESALEGSRRYEQGYILGTGIKHNKLSFEIRYEGGNGMSGYANLSSSTKRYFLLLGYKF